MMRWLGLVMLLAAAVATISADPDPKKYKTEVKDNKQSSALTDEERKFLREVEEKFGIKSEVPVETKSDTHESKLKAAVQGKLPFPAVIAIEIVNDTDSKTKGKRTIDANLGYGYRTNNGYTYTYFGKQNQEKGKYMIYPYSQEDIPPAKSGSYHSHQLGTTPGPSVEIQPSQAYELVPVKEEEISYQQRNPVTEYMNKYENVKGIEAPPPPYSNPSQTTTLYTTYNGEQFSGLSGQFPKVMSNYLVDSTQLLKNPEYQNAGLTQDYIKQHGQQLEHRVVPVLVLRIPSSYIKNPSAELYANLKQDYPLSQYLNQINLQELVNQYFKKIGIPNAPQVMTYSSLPINQGHPSSHSAVSNHHSHNYAAPYVRPSYTHADYSGLQYSAVQPVMAKYPSRYPAQQYYVSHSQSSYSQPAQQQYEYQYKYVPQSEGHEQKYYEPQYQYQTQEASHEEISPQQDSNLQYSAEEYGEPQQSTAQSHYSSGYELSQSSQNLRYEKLQSPYELPKEQYTKKNVASTYESPSKEFVSAYRNSKPQYVIQTETPTDQSYYQHKTTPKENVAIISHSSSLVQKYNHHSEPSEAQTYVYHKQNHDDTSGEDLVLTENYPSKDHTIATVLPHSYKVTKESKPVQAVNYVTPVPYSSKFQSQYRTMVPQTVLKGPTQEKVSYVNSHSAPQYNVQVDYSAEKEYTTDSHYLPPLGSQKAPAYPRNYHSHPKRMVKPEQKEQEEHSTTSKKHNERHTKKKST